MKERKQSSYRNSLFSIRKNNGGSCTPAASSRHLASIARACAAMSHPARPLSYHLSATSSSVVVRAFRHDLRTVSFQDPSARSDTARVVCKVSRSRPGRGCAGSGCMNLPFPATKSNPSIGRPRIHRKKVPRDELQQRASFSTRHPRKPIKEARDFSQILTCSADLTKWPSRIQRIDEMKQAMRSWS